jgi:hypothetical protein
MMADQQIEIRRGSDRGEDDRLRPRGARRARRLSDDPSGGDPSKAVADR